MTDNHSGKSILKIVYSVEFEDVLKQCKKKNKILFARIEKQIMKIIREPMIGKPLRHSLKNRRRIHIGSFVLIYEFYGGELRFIDLDHHDNIYKKY